MAGGNQMDPGSDGGWGQGLEGCIFLTGLGREVAEAEQFSGVAMALTMSPIKPRVGKGFWGRWGAVGAPGGAVLWAQPC